MFKLVISDDEGQTTVVPLLRDEITIGRREGNTIRLTERNVSRNHARLVRRNGSYVVEDLGSYNGVMLNGQRVDAEAELSSGDQLGIGDYELALRADAEPAYRQPRPPDVRSGPPPRLVVLSEPAAGAEFSLSKSIMRIGRDERLDIWINHKSISHEHAEIQVAEGMVSVFDLDSANGIRVNGIDTTRAILETGDELELGDVRFRFLVPQGAHTLDELPRAMPPEAAPPPARKPLFALALITLLVSVGAAVVVVTMRDSPIAQTLPEPIPTSTPTAPAPVEPEEPEPVQVPAATSIAAEAPPPPKPQELLVEAPTDEKPPQWESRLSRAQARLARGKIDEAYRIAKGLPRDSALRRSPEFGEIRYRYAQSHISAGEKALNANQLGLARKEAKLVLGLEGITPKQRRDAKRLLNQARPAKASSADGISAQDALAEAHRCVAIGDNACVIRALEGGRARSPGALALLIETYRAMDDLPSARRHMRAFVQRYPTNPRTPQYRQMLASR